MPAAAPSQTPPRAVNWQGWGVQHASGCTYPNGTKGGGLAGIGPALNTSWGLGLGFRAPPKIFSFRAALYRSSSCCSRHTQRGHAQAQMVAAQVTSCLHAH